MNAVTVRGLSKAYPSFRLNDVSFTLETGKITGFIGRNGAGKTTTIKSMLHLVHPDSGDITYFGLPLSSHEAQIKQRIGYSTGSVSWYPHTPIRRLTGIVKRFYPGWDPEAYRRYLSLFGLDEDKCPAELSEGMKAKCSLLTALSHRPEVLLLDEPTSGLDPFSREELLEILLGLKEEGVTVFFSTHVISDIEKCADNILYIRGGRIVSACEKNDFVHRCGAKGETLEETILRLERSAL